MTWMSLVLWLYGIAWHERRTAMVAYLGLLAGDIAAIGGFGFALRAVVNDSLRGDVASAVLAATAAALCWAVTTVGASARANMVMLLAEAVSVRLDERILRMAGGLPSLHHLESARYADQLALLRGGGDLLGYYAWRALDVVAMLLRLLIVLIMLALVAPVMLILAAALIPVLWLQRAGQKRISRSDAASGEDVRLTEHMHALLTEPVPGMEIRVAGAGVRLREIAAAAWARLIRRQERARYAAAGLTAAGWVLFMAAYAGALVALVDSVASGRTGPGDVLLVIMLTMSLRAQAESALTTMQRNANGMHHLDAFRWLHGLDGVPRGAEAAVPERLTEGITLRKVSFTYPGTAVPVLHEIDLRLEAGSTVAVVGEHGAGKTTLVKLLCGLYEPTSGGIHVDGTPLSRLSVEEWRARITANFQDYARFAFPVREAVGVGQLAALDDLVTIERAVARADAEGMVAALPAGLDTQLGSLFGGVELSGGQWQRVALSRAFMRSSPLLFVLDEPTASLDARSEYALYQRQMEAARDLARKWGTVTMVISHRFSTVRMADQIIVLRGGRVAERGSHDELLALNGLYAELYRMQENAYSPGEITLPTPLG